MYKRQPVYSPFLRVDTIINGQTIESVNQYNQVCYMYVNTNTDIAGKAGAQYSYGYNGAQDSTLTSTWDGHTIAANTADESIAMSALLICNILAGCEKLIPSFLLPSIRLSTLISIVEILGLLILKAFILVIKLIQQQEQVQQVVLFLGCQFMLLFYELIL